jgi:hypothetical protein
MRVRIPEYAADYASDPYGEIVKITYQKPTGMARMMVNGGMLVVAHVKLEKSGKVISVLRDDCIAWPN